MYYFEAVPLKALVEFSSSQDPGAPPRGPANAGRTEKCISERF